MGEIAQLANLHRRVKIVEILSEFPSQLPMFEHCCLLKVLRMKVMTK